MRESIYRKPEPRLDPGILRVGEESLVHFGSLEIVVPHYTDNLTARVLQTAASLARGLNGTLKLIAVYVAPYPAELRCPAAVEERLATRLAGLARQTGMPATVQLLVARDRFTAFREVLDPRSTVLLGSARRLWRTREEKLARALTQKGHLVSLLHFD